MSVSVSSASTASSSSVVGALGALPIEKSRPSHRSGVEGSPTPPTQFRARLGLPAQRNHRTNALARARAHARVRAGAGGPGGRRAAAHAAAGWLTHDAEANAALRTYHIHE